MAEMGWREGAAASCHKMPGNESNGGAVVSCHEVPKIRRNGEKGGTAVSYREVQDNGIIGWRGETAGS